MRPMVERLLIINADDFGLTDGINQGIVEAHQRGVVTSASLMVRAPAAAGAASLTRANPNLGVGLHFDIGEWLLRDGDWTPRYEYIAEGDAAAAETELEAQVALFQQLTGVLPDHLDSHQHVHMSRPEVSQAMSRVAGELGVEVRSTNPRVAYCGMYGQDEKGRAIPDAITPSAYIAAIQILSPGVTEFGCHPGYLNDLESDYRLERAIELRTLCDPCVRASIEEHGVRLIRWSDLKAVNA
jgi:predicted glycoside hydrolase/deacetylase ChbG (UPF0249 family)